MKKERTITEVATMGGEAVKKKYGLKHYQMMNKKSCETKRKNKAKKLCTA